jgi:F420-dependent oxidoreductase-like protein
MLKPAVRASLTLPDYQLPGVAPERLMDRLRAIATTAEQSGFDAIFLMDHVQHSGEPGLEGRFLLEGPTTLGALAACTERAQLGLMTASGTYRNPALLAKITTTIDVLSGGRAILGIGAGWLEHEHVAYGWRFPSTRERFEILEDALRISRAMFTQDAATVEGTHWSIAGALNRPRPIRGDIPILIGGNGERKTLRFVAQYGDACNVFGDADEVRRLMGVLDAHCEDVGRDPSEIWRTAFETVVVAATHELAHAKLAAVRASSPAPGGEAAIVGDPDEVAEQVAARVAAGLDGLVVNVYDADDLASLALAGRAVCNGLA